MTRAERQPVAGLAGAARGTRADPLRSAWGLLTNVKFALVLVGGILASGLVGTVVPQIPPQMRGNAAARAAWLELRRDDFGVLTGPMDALWLFDIFRSPWFTGLWALVVVAVTVCTVSRIRPTWRSVSRPPRLVPDAYFERAHHRASFAHPGSGGPIEAALQRRRYRVETVRREGDRIYLFADRFAWSQYATFVSHLALLVLLVGALLTMLAGFDRTLVIAESTPAAPVFDQAGPGQIFVRVVDAFRGVDENGNIVDFRTDIEVRRGEETVRCRVTVNGPCGAFGHRVHLAAFFDDLAGLRVLAPGGAVLFDGVLDFEGRAVVVPILEVTGAAGKVLFSEPVPQLATDPGTTSAREDDVALGALYLAGDPGAAIDLGLAWTVVAGELRLVVSSSAGLATLAPGDSFTAGGYRVTHKGSTLIPATTVADMPGAGEAGATVQLVPRSDGTAYLVLSGIDDENVALAAGSSRTNSAGYQYSFRGRVEASALGVRRDPGDTFIWVGVGMGLLGLAVTFYVPRRRIWLRLTPGRLWMAGLGDRGARMEREFRALAEAAGYRDQEAPG